MLCYFTIFLTVKKTCRERRVMHITLS